jgi:hypothetical protein
LNGIKVLDFQFSHHLFIHIHGDLENVALLRLDKEEKHGLGAVGSRADENHTPLRIIQVILQKTNLLLPSLIHGVNKRIGGSFQDGMQYAHYSPTMQTSPSIV